MRHHPLARTLPGVRVRSSSIGRTALLAAALGLLACRGTRHETDDPTAGAADDAGQDDEAGSAKVTQWSRPGAGHTSNIDRVAISSDGTAVVTRDQIGGTRLWPALDGSLEPIVIPVQGPQQFTVEARKDGGFTVAAVDSAGGAKIFGVGDDGRVTELGALPPFQPLFGIYVLPGGDDVLALFRDHSIRLLDRAGAEQFTFEESRFRPTSLRIGADGRSFAALLTTTGAGNKLEVQPMKVVAGKDGRGPSITRVGAARELESANSMGETTAVLSPDAKRFAVVDKPVGNDWEIVVADLGDPQKSNRILVPVPAHLVPNIGFVSAKRLLVSTNDGSLSWVLDLDDGSRHARTSAPQDFINQGRAQGVAGGVQAAGHGTWLFVYDLRTRAHRYLGYRSFQTQSVAVSPSGDHVAWAYMAGPVFVETLGGDHGERVELPSDPSFGTIKVRFFDDEHVITVDGVGGIYLYRWRDAKLIDQAGIHGAIRALHFEPDRGLMAIERHNNDVRLFEVGAEGFEGPYIVADQSFRAGLLAKGAHDDAVLWTLDSGNVLRHYSLAELRDDPSQEAVMAKGVPIPPGKVAPLAIDPQGRQYGVRWNGSTMELFVDDADKVATKVSAAGDISSIVPSPSGERFVAIHQRGQSTSLAVHDTKTLDEQWSFATGVFNNEVVWSPDGRFVAVAANTGAVVLDAETGKPVQRRCGIEFEASAAPPSSAFNSLNLRSMCED